MEVLPWAIYGGSVPMKSPIPVSLCLASLSFLASTTVAQDKQNAPPTQDKARIFITDSTSWEMSGHSGGSSAGFGGEVHGGARPQTAEIIKTFGERCPQVVTNNIQANTDYVVVLDHEGGKGLLRHRNKVAVFNRVSGDSIVSKSTLSLGGSVQEACEAITRDWSEHGASMRAEASAAQEKLVPAAVRVPAKTSTAKLQIDSTPAGADIEVVRSFVGSTPSDVQVAEGDHTVVVKKSGFKNWERKLKSSAGSSVHI